ncbi:MULTISPECIES: 2OG-Fe(II) oxygenase [Planktothrix]|jgi:Rps23 Pro-64 3,4-dihydroxylase Tpa1-like proline 4-hydroxylase|uniref:Proline hydroxylase n=2 Tax=Planktothrix TaxID=54304 RepID=A0A073CE42_PLAA1|nr:MULTISPECIES: 2OG-Fe(II) oxygenase [Planktothrix]CAD5942454.1 putative PKHD-type hydroxylase sll0191 [Planktothrix rubescens]KEI66579.1 proline hydroxylase [Planktothrix agardhii NIVA-CYA 126/8]CAC5342296.1 putative Prolyl 4-hydroxylase, alpha subunit [Planktothrix rubescens NIVA-CYA 18]CAD5923854.1 putative PKHD-type hydroxylase sll0191 [Planktothrix rubescens NIVA-CYA 18]CAD5932668.1 putative PKHD-type hydroxylase sll0191 [Planktothrix agardhii]
MPEKSSPMLSNMEENQDYNSNFDQILNQALDIVKSSLNQPDITYEQRLNAALKILEIGILSQQKDFNSNLSEVIPSPDNSSNITEPKAIIINPDYVQIDNFFSEEDYQKLLNSTLANQNNFFSSEVINNESEYRQSYILLPEHFAEFHELITHKLLTARPQVMEQLQIQMFLVAYLEIQITAHLHGGYYKIHQDVDGGKAANRKLTYVYYFYQEPQGFYGGDLRLYQTKIQGEEAIIYENFTQIKPLNNSIIFFDSRCKHEVLPVYCPSEKFTDSRFTLNGWIHG